MVTGRRRLRLIRHGCTVLPAANLQNLLLPSADCSLCTESGRPLRRLPLLPSLENPSVALSPSQGESLAYILLFLGRLSIDLSETLGAETKERLIC